MPSEDFNMIFIVNNNLSIPVLAAGKGWLVVDKPPGLSIHNEPGKDLRSLLQACIKENLSLAAELDCDSSFGLHAVHRLDKEAGGVILLACRTEVFRHYAGQFETGSVSKRYVALVHGTLVCPACEDTWIVWEWPLSRHDGGRLDPAGHKDLVPCRTRLRVLRHSRHYALIECEPLTGRKHQIRRHAKIAGHPVVGDQRYGSNRALRHLRDKCSFTRLALHSMSLTICPPDKDNPETIKSLGIPEEISRLIDRDAPEGE